MTKTQQYIFDKLIIFFLSDDPIANYEDLIINYKNLKEYEKVSKIRSLNTQVCYLRKQPEVFLNYKIITIRNKGYKLIRNG